MKKILSYLLMLTMVLTLTACGAKNNDSDSRHEKKDKESGNTVSEQINQEDASLEQAGGTSTPSESGAAAAEDFAKAHSDWVGFYYNDNRNSKTPGYIEVSVTDDGKIIVDYLIETKKNHLEFTEKKFNDEVTWQESFDLAEKAVAGFTDADGNEYKLILFEGKEYPGISLYEADKAGNEIFRAFYRKAVFVDRSKPADYNDTDVFGDITEALKDESGHFTPATDNYVVFCYGDSMTSVYDADSQTEKVYSYTAFYLVDLDENGLPAKTTLKWVFPSAEEAQSYHDYSTERLVKAKNNILDGKTIYMPDDPGYFSDIFGSVDSFDIYYDCNYFYRKSFENEEPYSVKNYIYLNKPVSHKEYEVFPVVNEKNARLYASWFEGYHKCTKETCQKVMWTSRFDPEKENLQGLGNVLVDLRLYDDHAVNLQYGSSYYIDDETGQIVEYYGMAVNEYVFTEDTITLTEYFYEVEKDDMHSGVAFDNTLGLTLDNYKDIEPFKILTHTFDMSKNDEPVW